MRDFENQLGFRLFDRTTRHVSLTTDGAELLAAARRSLQDFDSAIARIGERVRESSQTFSIGAGHIVAANILPSAMKEFLAGRPDLSIEVSDDDLITIIERVRAGSLDMGIGSFPSLGGVRRTLFFRFSLMVIRTDSETAPHRASTTWSGLKGERLIVPLLQPVRMRQKPGESPGLRVNPNQASLENYPARIVMQILHPFAGSIQQYLQEISDSGPISPAPLPAMRG